MEFSLWQLVIIIIKMLKYSDPQKAAVRNFPLSFLTPTSHIEERQLKSIYFFFLLASVKSNEVKYKSPRTRQPVAFAIHCCLTN